MIDDRSPPASDDEFGSGDTSEPLGVAAPRRIWRPQDFQPPHPESLSAPAYLTVTYAQIEGDPYNVRQTLRGVDRLAWSLYMHGLLENLVVIDQPNEQLRARGVDYQLKAGSRRFAAIGRLIEGIDPPPGHPDRELGRKWQWPANHPIQVRVLGSNGTYEHLLENLDRDNPHPWEVGRRIAEILSAGVSSRELGLRLNRSNGWINRYAHIGEGLAPELIAVLIAEKANLQVSELARFAQIRDRFGDADGAAQVALYREQRMRKRRRPRRMDKDGFRAAMRRLQHLRTDTPVPPLLRPVVEAVIRYLDGGEPPKFRELERKLLTAVQALAGDDGEGELA
jgi:hypothetical protein